MGSWQPADLSWLFAGPSQSCGVSWEGVWDVPRDLVDLQICPGCPQVHPIAMGYPGMESGVSRREPRSVLGVPRS